MEETIIEIPEAAPEEGWQPPVLTHEPAKKQRSQSVTDVFFIQYAVCIFLLTAFLVIRCIDRELFAQAASQLLAQMHAPTEAIMQELCTFLQSQWS